MTWQQGHKQHVDLQRRVRVGDVDLSRRRSVNLSGLTRKFYLTGMGHRCVPGPVIWRCARQFLRNNWLNLKHWTPLMGKNGISFGPKLLGGNVRESGHPCLEETSGSVLIAFQNPNQML